MTKYKQVSQQVNVIDYVQCDICGQRCGKGLGDFEYEYLKMEAHWGFMSDKDLEKWEAAICEPCVDKYLSPIIKFNKSSCITGGKINTNDKD